jgi:dTMP kinase
MPRARGAFIVVEGMDRCGKTTQCARLVQRLIQAGVAAISLRFPNRSSLTGQLINSYLSSNATSSSDAAVVISDEVIHLLFSANRWESAPIICQHLEAGTTIICDRYAYSGVAFSSAKVKAAEQIVNPNKHPNSAGYDSENAAQNMKSTDCDTNTLQDAADTKERTSDGDQEFVLSMDWCKSPDRGLPAPDCVLFLDVPPEVAEQRGGYVIYKINHSATASHDPMGLFLTNYAFHFQVWRRAIRNV